MAVDVNIGNEMESAEIGLGQLIEKIGKAVGETTLKLAKTSASTASTLATTLVDVIAVEEITYNEDGTRGSITPHTRKLPLINFIDPVFYEWSNVRVQGTFVVQEFADSSTANTYKSDRTSKSGQGGLLTILGLGRTTEEFHSTETNATQNSATDRSYGSIRMNALLQPRTDVGVPKPKLSIKGPTLSILQGEITTVMPTGTTAGERTMTLTISFKKGMTAIAGKLLSIETDGVAWEYSDPSVTTTDATGQVALTLKRPLIPGEGVDPTYPPIPVIVSVRKGMVSTSSTINV